MTQDERLDRMIQIALETSQSLDEVVARYRSQGDSALRADSERASIRPK